jgi:hypothetical protein
MQVRATRLGYYGHERRPEGAVFVLEPIKRIRKDKEGRERMVTISAEQQFSDRWMERVGPGAKSTVKVEAPRKERAFSETIESEPVVPRGKAKVVKQEVSPEAAKETGI